MYLPDASTMVLAFPTATSTITTAANALPANVNLGLGLLSHHKGTTPGSGWSSLIGIVTAIIGNVLISFALNLQRYAHLRLSRERDGLEEEQDAKAAERRRKSGRSYGTQTSQGKVAEQRAKENAQDDALEERAEYTLEQPDGRQETDPLIPHVHSRGGSTGSDDTVKPPANEKEQGLSKGASYLQSPIWWLGIALMVVGEAGNFLAYGFAPASIVSPMGVVALVSNCIIAPLVLGERFRWRDGVGVIIAVAGCVTVVLSASDSNPRLTPDLIWHLITQWEFETYFGITVVLIVVLMVASNKFGDRTILIDVGLVGLFGGYTALSTKGIASLLSNTIWRVVTFPITYLLVAVLVSTAVMQIKYINRALQRFDATMVIPTQFVLFTLSVIVGSAILYRDFERETAEDAGKFVGGCALTFLGVWCITSGRSDDGGGDEEDGDEDDAISLVDEEGVQPEIRDGATSTTKRISFMTGSSSPQLKRVRTGDSLAPSLIITPDLQPADDSPERIADLGPAQQAAIHTESMAQLPRPSLDPTKPPAFHATTSAPIVPTKADLSSNFRPRTPLNRYTSTPAGPHPSLRGSPTSSKLQGGLIPIPPQDQHRLSVAGLLPGPLMSPLSSSLAAIVADSLRRGIDSPASTLRRNASHRKRQRGNTGSLATLPDGDGTRRPSTALLQRHSISSDTLTFEDSTEGHEEMDADELASLRKAAGSPPQGRVRSLSATVADLFGSSSKQRPRNGSRDSERR